MTPLDTILGTLDWNLGIIFPAGLRIRSPEKSRPQQVAAEESQIPDLICLKYFLGGWVRHSQTE